MQNNDPASSLQLDQDLYDVLVKLEGTDTTRLVNSHHSSIMQKLSLMVKFIGINELDKVLSFSIMLMYERTDFLQHIDFCEELLN